MYHQYNYADVLAASQKINWRIEDLIGGQKRLDFSKPFMPESLARTNALSFLNKEEKRVLNQIRGHGYLYIFGVVEEFILPFVMDHLRSDLQTDDMQTRAFLGFAAEEAKHIDLFKRFRKEFQRDFDTECQVIGPAEAIGKAVLAHHPLAVSLLILQIEWMTQSHYVDSIKDDLELDPMFKDLLKHHWMEEAQHAKLDTLMTEALARSCSEDEISKAIDDYFKIGAFLDGGLRQQAIFDLESLIDATGCRLSDQQREAFIVQQHQAQRWTYIGSGMIHRNFLATLQHVSPKAREQIEAAAVNFC